MKDREEILNDLASEYGDNTFIDFCKNKTPEQIEMLVKIAMINYTMQQISKHNYKNN